jgi:dephospho-coA kinase
MVYAPEAIRLQRVMARDNATEAAARQRMQRQWPDERKIALSDAVITNDGRAALIPQVEAFVKTYAP